MKPNPILRALACLSLLAVVFPGWAPSARGANGNPPERMSYQGFLTDANGLPLGNTNTGPRNYDVVFRLWDDQGAGNELWGERQTVTVDKGYFTVLLGEGTTVGAEPHWDLSNAFTNGSASDRYIEMTVLGIGQGSPPSDVKILPRLRLLTSPYAFLARNAVNAAGLVNGADGAVVTVVNNAVGINTNNPAAALDVNGDAKAHNVAASGSITVGGNLSVSGSATASSLNVGGPASANSLTVNGAATANTLTLSGAATASSLTVNGPVSASSLGVSGASGLILGNGSAGSAGVLSLSPNQASPVSARMAFGTDGTGWQFRLARNKGGTLGDLVTVTDAGNVGIGRPPTGDSVLDVLGVFDVDLANYGGGRFCIRNNTNDNQVYLEFGGTGGSFSPSAAHISGWGASELSWLKMWSHRTEFFGDDGRQVRFTDANNSSMYWDVGTDSPNGSLDFFCWSGVESWLYRDGHIYAPSDIRLKKEVREETGLLDKVLKLRPVSYSLTNAPAGSPRSLGFIAQELEMVFPQMVSQSRKGIKGVAYGQMVPVSIGAIQELHAQVQSQKADIEKLQGQVAELRAMVEKLANR